MILVFQKKKSNKHLSHNIPYVVGLIISSIKDLIELKEEEEESKSYFEFAFDDLIFTNNNP
ncbi:hypothetical protein DERP_004686 [Dermatophagoides pteronyssinus]|uniref:Uncharacterized protein n=1 Tax=Dermatophagoides pteronyssinus TaxID=6956 RepID=A0ABQ8JPG5_DERPT|nr:hypothetical protein DERP_004686 [Dermatophagoides pteronyssinus]